MYEANWDIQLKMLFNPENIASNSKNVLTNQICCHISSPPSYYPKCPLNTSIRQGMVKMALLLLKRNTI